MSYSKHTAQIILNVTLISAFIGIFFFTYAAKVEKDIVKSQSEYIATDLAESIKSFIPEKTRIDLSLAIGEPTGTEDVDKAAEDSNNKLLKKAAISLGIVFIIGVVLTFVIVKFANIELNILKESFVILLFVAFTEYMFLNIVTRNYKIADTNFVKKEILTSVKKSFPEKK